MKMVYSKADESSRPFWLIYQNLQEPSIQSQSLKYARVCSTLYEETGRLLEQIQIALIRVEELLILVEGCQVFEVNLPNQHIKVAKPG